MLAAGVRGDYTPSPSGSGYTTPAVNTPLPSQHNPTVTYPAPTPVPYTTTVVHAQPSTPTTPSVTTMSTHSGDPPYSGVGQNSIPYNNGYSYPIPDSYSPLYQQLTPNFISQYYKQPPYVFSHPPQPPSPSQSLNPPAFHPHPCSSPNNNHPFQPQQPYFQHTLFQVPNPLNLLNGFAPPNSFHAMVNPPAQRGPLPSPGYYSPEHPPSQPLFSVGYTPPTNRPLPYNVH